MGTDELVRWHTIELTDPALDYVDDPLVPGVYVGLLLEPRNLDEDLHEVQSTVSATGGGTRHTGYQRQRYEPRDPKGYMDWGKPLVDWGEVAGIGVYQSFKSKRLLWAMRFPGGRRIAVRRGVSPKVNYHDLERHVAQAKEAENGEHG